MSVSTSLGGLFFVLLLSSSYGAFIDGELLVAENWVFLAKFAFDTNGPGNITYQIWQEVNATQQVTIALYDDESTSWPDVYDSSLTCQEKLEKAKWVLYLTNGKVEYIPVHDIVQPHFWYLAAGNCAATKLDLRYLVWFENSGGWWTRQISFDDQGLPEMYLVFTLLYLFLVVIHFIGVRTLIQRQFYHPVIRLMSSALICEAFACLFFFLHWAIYADNGIGAPGLHGLAEILDITSTLLFFLLLILMASGFTISKNSATHRRLTMTGLGVMVLAFVILFIWENVGRDPASTTYIYETVPGIILLVLRGFVMLWFFICIRSSYKAETLTSRKRFFVKFVILYGIWFLILPIIVIIAASVHPVYRAKVVFSLYVTMHAVGFFYFIWIFWPSRASSILEVPKSQPLLDESSNPAYDSL